MPMKDLAGRLKSGHFLTAKEYRQGSVHMAAKDLATKSQGRTPEEGTEKVPLESLSELTGFPVEFIKKELLLDEESLSMNDLRKSMAVYLENTVHELNS